VGNSSDACDVHEVATRPLRIAPVFDVNRKVKQTPARKVTRSRPLRFQKSESAAFMLPDCVVTVCVGATVDRKVKQTLMRMRDEIVHENVARFFGISSHADDAAVCLVEQYCANGTLVEFLLDNEHIVDHPFRYVVCADVASGMAYLHRHDLTHGTSLRRRRQRNGVPPPPRPHSRNLSAPTSPAEWRTSTATTSFTETSRPTSATWTRAGPSKSSTGSTVLGTARKLFRAQFWRSVLVRERTRAAWSSKIEASARLKLRPYGATQICLLLLLLF